MTSMHVDQLAQEESPPTVPAHTLGDPTVAATRGNTRDDPNLTGNFSRPLAAHGNFRRRLASLSHALFTQGNAYRASETNDPPDPVTYGNSPGNTTWTTAAHGNITRPLEAHEDSLPAQGNAYRVVEDHLPYLPEGYLALTAFGVTKEITASSQDPDQTLRRPKQLSRRLTSRSQEVTMEIQDLPLSPPPHHVLTAGRILTASYRVNTYHIRHHLTFFHLTVHSTKDYEIMPPPTLTIFTTITHHTITKDPSTTYLPYSPHHHYFTSTLLTNGYKINPPPTFPYPSRRHLITFITPSQRLEGSLSRHHLPFIIPPHQVTP